MATRRTTPEKKPPATKGASKERPAPSTAPATVVSTTNLAYTDEAAVLTRCADAMGLAGRKPGFARTPERDALFALGWPHLRWLTQGSGGDLKADALQVHLEYPAYRLEWPRDLAEVLLRAWGTRVSVNGPGSEKMKAALSTARPGAISKEEAASLLGTMLGWPSVRIPYEAEPLLLLEAMLGAEVVAEVVVTLLERFDEEMWNLAPRDDVWTLFPLGYLLLRAPAASATPLRARLEARWAIGAKGSPKGELTRMVDVILHGSEGAQRSALRLGGGAFHPRYLGLCTDDPAIVAKAVLAYEDAEGRDHARLSFLGGEPVVARYAKLWRTLKRADAQEWFRWTMGEIQSPKIEAMMREMSTASKVKKAAAAWLERCAK